MISRRGFVVNMLALRVAGALAPGEAVGDADAFPKGNYTPFGYLDNPFHAWNSHRSGILRSLPGIGFARYFPAGPGGYFDFKKNEVYEAHLGLGFRIGDRLFQAPEDFHPGQLFSPYHSKNLMVYEFTVQGVRVEVTFVQAKEDALAAQIELDGEGAGPVEVIAWHQFRLGGAEWWGRDGLAGQYDQKNDLVWIRSFAAGPVFALAADRPSTHHAFEPAGVSYYPKPLTGSLHYVLRPPSGMTVVLARGSDAAAATEEARASLGNAATQIAMKRGEDTAFWRRAPRLEGDWPDQWKHGWVYDFETLRMMVRRPVGVYKHPWDAMQIQAPRNVLAETSIDMWALSYADPDTAKEVFLGQFLDAVHDNIPCMREDGEMNMVAVDGSECGTSISWCYPYFCAASIFDRTGGLVWLRKLYPGLARLLRWTLANRKDAGGFLVGKCSWETGMDASKRFLIEQPTGGELTEFVRLVELQAAAAQAGAILARFAGIVGDREAIGEWQEVHRTYTAKTQELWQGDWFHDFDTRAGRLVTNTERDPAQSAPAFCGLATAEQRSRMAATLRKFYEDSKRRGQSPAAGWDDGLAWSSIMLPYIESLWAVGEGELLSQVIETVADRIYTSMDRRSLESNRSGEKSPALGWPGVSCEIWGAHGAFGGEGYGWGAVMPAHLIRNIVGIRETADAGRLSLSPNLPARMMSRGGRYGISGLNLAGGRLDLSLNVSDKATVEVTGKWHGAVRVTAIQSADGAKVQQGQSGQTFRFTARNHSRYHLDIAGL